MDQANVAAALTVTPAVALQLSWVENTVYLVPADPLEAGSRYTFTLSTPAHNPQGTPLAATQSWAYCSPHTLLCTEQQQPLTPLLSHQHPALWNGSDPTARGNDRDLP